MSFVYKLSSNGRLPAEFKKMRFLYLFELMRIKCQVDLDLDFYLAPEDIGFGLYTV